MSRLLQRTVLVIVGAIVLRYFYGYFKPQNVSPLSADEMIGHVPIQKDLENFIKDFDGPPGQRIIKETDGIYKAVGYAFGHSIIIEGPDGLVVVDTTESDAAGAKILADLRNITNKPIKAFVYTHFHNDHVQGTQGFIEDPVNPPDIWAHYKNPQNLKGNLMTRPKTLRGAYHQFGTVLGQARAWPNANEPAMKVLKTLFPNRLVYNDEEHVNIAGLDLSMLYAPGETDDQLVVWYPAKRALMIADTLFKMFPNMYAIRGTPTRDMLVWAKSIRRMRTLKPDILIPSHGPSVQGQQQIEDLLTAYASAIQFVHDQTVRYMNLQYHPDEIARLVQLPPSLASNPYLFERYGRVDWSSKAVYQHYVGWFSGDPVELIPLTPKERSQRMVDMFGDERMLDEAESSLKAGDAQWALELSSQVRQVQPDNKRACKIRLKSLQTLAGNVDNPSARNFYLTMILDDHGLIEWKIDVSEMLEVTDIESLLNVLKVRLRAESAHGVNQTLYLHFHDSNSTFRLQILYSVLTVDRVSHTQADSDLKITTTERTWKTIFAGKLTMAAAYSNGDVTTTGSLVDIRQFLSLFDGMASATDSLDK